MSTGNIKIVRTNNLIDDTKHSTRNTSKTALVNYCSAIEGLGILNYNSKNKEDMLLLKKANYSRVFVYNNNFEAITTIDELVEIAESCKEVFLMCEM